MTISSTNVRNGPYYPNGATTQFPFTFRAIEKDDIQVVQVNALAEVIVSPSLYDVVIAENGGTVVFATAPSGDPIVIEMDPSFQQLISLENEGAFLPEVVTEGLDRADQRALWLRDQALRSLRFGDGYVDPLPFAAARANRALAFDALGRPIMAPGSLAQLATDLSNILYRLGLLEFGASVTPFNSAAVASDWSSMANLARAVRTRAFTNIPIKFAGIGSSNMKNENGSLAGPGNSPVEVALRAAKAMLDPFGFCVWDFRNFGVNGSAVSGYAVAGLDANPDPRSPRVKLLEYDPDLLVLAYGTNDSAPEAYNSGQTRNYIFGGFEAIAKDCKAIDCDMLAITVPSAKVSASVPVRINATIPVSYPKSSFQIGQNPFPETFSFSASGNRITATRSVFNDAATWGFGLAVNTAIAVTDANLGSSIANTGKFRVSAKDAGGMWIEVDRKLKDDGTGYTLVDDGAAAFTTSGPVSASIKRIAINNSTELQPNADDGSKLIEPLGDGRKVRVLTRFFDINQVQRETLATLDMPVAQVDIEAVYNVKLIQYGTLDDGEYKFGEDRYYSPVERVHWNSVLVSEIMEPTFVAFFRALGPVPKTISNRGAPRYLRSLVSRPLAGASDPLSLLDPNGVIRPAIDVMLDEKNGAIRNAAGAILLEFVSTPGTNAGNAQGHVRRRIRGGGNYQATYPISLFEFNRGTSTPLTIVMPSAGMLRGIVQGRHPGQSDTIYGVRAYYDGSAWSIVSAQDHSVGAFPGANTLSFSGSGPSFVMTPTAADSCLIFYDLQFTATVPVTPAFSDA